jgi:hypothetical protein
MLMTSAPLSADQRMPAAMSSKEPEPSASRTLTARMLASGATPAMPVALFVSAAAMPATCVPCGSPDPLSAPDCQSPLPHGLTFSQTNVAPPAILPSRSGWSRSTPESTIAMRWPEPVDVDQACSARTCCGPYCLP